MGSKVPGYSAAEFILLFISGGCYDRPSAARYRRSVVRRRVGDGQMVPYIAGPRVPDHGPSRRQLRQRLRRPALDVDAGAGRQQAPRQRGDARFKQFAVEGRIEENDVEGRGLSRQERARIRDLAAPPPKVPTPGTASGLRPPTS